MTQHQKIFLTIIALTLFICGRLESRRSEFANYDDFKFPRKDVRLELKLGNIWAEGHRMDQRVQEWVYSWVEPGAHSGGTSTILTCLPIKLVASYVICGVLVFVVS